MNRKLHEQLAQQAAAEIGMVGFHNIPSEFMEKFAALLVQECAGIFEQNGKICIPEHRIVDSIYIHFGLY